MANWKRSSGEPITTQSRTAVYCTDPGDNRQGWISVRWTNRPGTGHRCELYGAVTSDDGTVLDPEPVLTP